MSSQQIVEQIEQLPPVARHEIEVLIESFSKHKSQPFEPPTFSWEGGLKELRDEFTSVELQKGKTPYDRIKHLIGSVKDLPPDLSTNPKYMEDFGK
jgi:hypothetical protein